MDNIENAETAINQGLPTGGPERQQYSMKWAKRQLAELSTRLGRPLTCCINTFGCQMNTRNSEKLLGILETIGYKAAESEKADFMFYNTCTVRESANLWVYGRLGQLKAYEKKHPDMMIALCGCMMQEEEVVTKIKKSYRCVGLIFGIHNIFKLTELVSQCLKGRTLGRQEQGKAEMVVDAWEDTDQIAEDLPVERRFPFKSGANIMFSYNNFCSYYIMPYVKGRERSRRPGEIIKEMQKLVADEVVEVILLGQDVSSYRKNLGSPMTFTQLLEGVEKVDGIEWIRLVTSHPKNLSDELIKVMAGSKKICRHLHLPLQSGGSQILKVMNQCYTKEQCLDSVERIRKAVPGISLTTNTIVGFPGETDEGFEETMDMVRRVRFDSAFTFIYSERTGTPAAAMEDQASRGVVKERFDRFLKEVQDISAEVCRWDVRMVQEVLVEEVNVHTPGLTAGRLSNSTMMHLPGDPSMVGQLVPMYLQESRRSYYIGHMANKENR